MPAVSTCIHFELKYCERCGSLWLRPCGDDVIYCPACTRKIAELPLPRQSPNQPSSPPIGPSEPATAGEESAGVNGQWPTAGGAAAIDHRPSSIDAAAADDRQLKTAGSFPEVSA